MDLGSEETFLSVFILYVALHFADLSEDGKEHLKDESIRISDDALDNHIVIYIIDGIFLSNVSSNS